MKLTIEVELRRVDGKKCDASEVFDGIDAEWDRMSVFAQGADNDDETEYVVSSLTLRGGRGLYRQSPKQLQDAMTDHNVNIRFPKEPKPPRKHRARDIAWLIVAAALLSVPFGNSGLFAILSAVFMLAYLVTNRKERNDSA